MMVVIEVVRILVALLVVAVKIVLTVNLIGLLMDLNVAIQPGMSMVLTVLILKVFMAGIAQDVDAHVMVTQFVVMDLVMVTKLMKHAQMIVTHLVNVMLVI